MYQYAKLSLFLSLSLTEMTDTTPPQQFGSEAQSEITAAQRKAKRYLLHQDGHVEMVVNTDLFM